jgi:drug/metabolite transporter (DMT)-like permease
VTAPRSLLLWAALLAALTVLLLGWTRDELQLGLLGGAAAATVLMALVTLAARRQPAERRLVTASYGAPLVALGISAVVVGTLFGPWLWGPAALVVLAGVIAWRRESRA